ncbi:carbon-nitrogen hydrolase family protein [Sinisalibacter aestuarii]|uniref:Amidohydrolase n=1 Tax=Sinisalibacter aestuarii TaxID=2949426 RepID=A0ABQ5LN45_9RHOB|nr:carbon-nitrogen hydrolase family protein [Sinisalibacter aestuarii]GKY86429.1 amidohydrolase [Sinisalibacter aestuarii]
MRAGLVQLTSGDDPAANLGETLRLVREAVAGGADFVLTPEVTNIVSMDRAHQRAVLQPEAHDPTLAALRNEARAAGIWLLIGSLAVKTEDADGRFANRSFLISPQGEIAARYDKIHMFDVEISESETYRESAGYRPGTRAVLAETPLGRIGLTICYDLRFPELFRRLAGAGAQIITVPAAFSPVTGAAHWESLLRARAIETGCFILAPAQTGQHSPRRATHGHSLAVAPWGEVLADAGTEPGVTLVDLDLADVEHARSRVPSLKHHREFEGP